MSKESLIHRKIGDIFKKEIPNYTSCSLLTDHACGGKQRIPLFYEANKARATEYCNVDLIVLKENKIKIIVEIEESNVKPTQICGKYLASALSNFYIHEKQKNKTIEMADSVSFIQIVDTSKLKKDKTAKFKQWKALEKSINKILPVKNSRITSYQLLTTEDLGEVVAIIKRICE